MLACVAAIAAFAVGRSASDHLSYRPGDFYSHDSESFQTESELETILPEGARGIPNLGVIARDESGTAGAQIAERLKRNPLIAEVDDTILSSRDGKSSYVLAWLKEGDTLGSSAAKVERELAGPGVLVGGRLLARHEFAAQIDADLHRAQLIAFPLLLLLGLWVFRGLVAALLPVSVGGFALLIALGVFRLTAEVVPLSVFSLDIALGLALGLGVDYSLLMVSRFREGLAAGKEPRQSAAETLRTAGKTVALSSAAIATSFSALFVVPIPFVRSMAFGGGSVAIITGLSALVLLPALFMLLGHRVNALAPKAWQRSARKTARRREEGGWYRIAQFATRRPVPVALVSGALLVFLALPALSMRSTGLDPTSLPASSNSRQFVDQARKRFDNPLVGEVAVAIHGDEATATRVLKRVNELGERTGLATPLSVGFRHSDTLRQARLNPTEPVFSSDAQSFVSALREMKAPISVAGETAAYVDSVSDLERSLPLALAIVAASSFLFVFLATGSLVLPIKTLVMNVLSLGAALGLVVAIFQDGRLEALLDYSSQDALPVTLPLVMTAAAFGLLTDYGLFLLMRIKEERERGCSDREAIAAGLERTGRIITAAALLFCVAVGAFSTSGVLFIKMGAIAIALTVALDAFVVRPLLVPSLMAILGSWNWWPRKMPGGDRAK